MASKGDRHAMWPEWQLFSVFSFRFSVFGDQGDVGVPGGLSVRLGLSHVEILILRRMLSF
jgi:hypothetical protein